uniref:NADH-ubiquinone oxidoreductase chain 2 n=1 Tax=Crangonyx forbesi TaxID=111557 RepID=A0A6C0X5A8_9CRUS|nr:NADH dehydrogenase subunit 2 [Crangonyx forbesi]
MLLTPTSISLMITLAFSMLLSVSSNSWFLAWLGLEMNLMVFTPLILKNYNKYSSESTVKYFLTQTFASMLIMMAIAPLLSLGLVKTILIILVSLLLKMGAAPTHSWVPAVSSGVSWPYLLVLLTTQKVAPLFLASYTMNMPLTSSTMYMYIIASASLGSIGGLSQTALRKMLAFSSIAHLAWMLFTLILSSNLTIIYFIFYFIISLTLVYPIHVNQLSTINQILMDKSRLLKLNVIASTMSLSGLPPFTGFAPKMLVLMVSTNNTVIVLILVWSSVTSMFFYLRVILLSTYQSPSTMNTSMTSSYSMNPVLINLLGLPLTPILTNYAN